MPLNCEIELPQIAGHHSAGSSQGFLITVDRNAEIHASNPITGDRLPLPSTATLPNMIGIVRDPATGCIKRYVSSKNKRLKLQVRPLFFEDRRRNDFCSIIELNLKPGVRLFGVDYMRFSCYGRVAISPGLDFAAVLPTWGSMHLVPAFARLGRQDTSWTALPDPNKSVHDITFCDGRLYTIDECGTLAIFDQDNPSSPPKGPLGIDALRRPRFLVASPDGDDLFLVERIIDFCCSDTALRTMTFTVYMLDRSNFKWSRVTSIADYALFMGFNDSVALYAREFPCIKPNTIHFTDYHYYSSQYPNYYKDVGVFNLEDGSIHPPNDNFNKFNWPPPIWFTRAMF